MAQYERDFENGGKVVIIGSGLIGRNWAILFARGGYNVVLYDILKSQLTTALDDLKNKKIPLFLKFNMLNNKNPSDILNKIRISNNLTESLKNAIFVQECVPENLPLKQKIFEQIDQILYKINNKNCIISSSASTLVPSKLIIKMSQNSIFKENALVCHPVNPPMAIPLVEIVPSPITNKLILPKVKNIMIKIGMKPIIMKKESDGFVLNRLQYGLLQIAYQMVEDGIASPKDIDLAVSHGLGLRWSFMGPFETIHLNAPNGVNDYCQRYAQTCIEPVVQMQDNFRKWKPETFEKIHNAMAKDIPVDTIKERCEWRNNRLMELAELKNEQDAKDEKIKSSTNTRSKL